jgi:hypothetical protein
MYAQLIMGALLLTLGLALLQAPNSMEGPSLLHLSPGRGVSVSDVLALLVLATGAAVILVPLWRHRLRLAKQLHILRSVGGAEILCVGIMIGLVLAKGLAALPWSWLLPWAVTASPLLLTLVIAWRHR